MAPPTERHKCVQIEVRAALRALRPRGARPSAAARHTPDSASRRGLGPALGSRPILANWPRGDPVPAGLPHASADARSGRAVFVVSAWCRCAILPTWANVGGLVEGIVFVALTEGAHSANFNLISCLNFPFRQALATPREEDCHRMGRSHDLRADLEEPLHQLHGLDVGHRPEDVAAEALARRT